MGGKFAIVCCKSFCKELGYWEFFVGGKGIEEITLDACFLTDFEDFVGLSFKHMLSFVCIHFLCLYFAICFVIFYISFFFNIVLNIESNLIKDGSIFEVYSYSEYLKNIFIVIPVYNSRHINSITKKYYCERYKRSCRFT